MADAKQPNPPPAEPDDAVAGDDIQYQSLRHPWRSQPTPSYDAYRHERAASGGTQTGGSRGMRANGGHRDAPARPRRQATPTRPSTRRRASQRPRDLRPSEGRLP